MFMSIIDIHYGLDALRASSAPYRHQANRKQSPGNQLEIQTSVARDIPFENNRQPDVNIGSPRYSGGLSRRGVS